MISVDDMLVLLGGKLTDASTDVKERLRLFIEQDKWAPDDFERWIEECLGKGGRTDRAYHLILQDLVVSIGKRLGFEVEYGRYSGHPQEVAYDGLWKRPSEDVILLEVKASAWPVESVGQLGGYLQRYAVAASIPEGRVFGLYVIGSGELQPIVDQIRGSEYRSVLRAISCRDLLRLWRLKEDLDSIGAGTADRKIQAILLPVDSINIGAIIEIITAVAELRRAAEEIGETEVTEEGAGELKLPWDASTLLHYLNESTSFQKALLASLALSGVEFVSRHLLVHLMKQAVAQIPEAAERSVTGYTIAGARAGLKMRRGSREDIINEEGGTYRLNPAYKDLVTDWVRGLGLKVSLEDAAETTL